MFRIKPKSSNKPMFFGQLSSQLFALLELKTKKHLMELVFLSDCMGRFVLEPKSVLMNEQEQKLKDCEAAIASLQVASFVSFGDNIIFAIDGEMNFLGVCAV